MPAPTPHLTPEQALGAALWDEESILSDPLGEALHQKRLLVAAQYKEDLSAVPFYAQRAAKAAAAGDEMEYWLSLVGAPDQTRRP